MILRLLLPILITACKAAAAKNASYILPQGAGPYQTRLTISELVDESRMDPFNSSHVRRIMISRFDPVSKDLCNLTQIPYFATMTAAIEDEILASYEFPRILSQFSLDVCASDNDYSYPATSYYDGFPVVLYSPGLNTTRLFGSTIAQEIASHGFTTITIDHPYDVDVVEFPNGDVILGGRVIKPADINGSTASLEHALEVRAQDVSFVLDVLGVSDDQGAMMFGDSFGGAATATSMLHDKRIRAGVNMDGAMFGPVLNTSLGSAEVSQKFILWGSDGHNTTSDETWGQFWSTLEASPYVDYAKEMGINGSTHASYWDLAVVVDTAGIRDQLSINATALVGPLDGLRVSSVLGRYLSSFFWFAQNGVGSEDEDEIFKGPSAEFPEVVILDTKTKSDAQVA